MLRLAIATASAALLLACVDPAPPTLSAVGEACEGFESCISGVCHTTAGYCTERCTDHDACSAAGLSDGCCVSGEAGAGFCLAVEGCAEVCGPNAYPVGLPTTCACLEGFGPAPSGERGCVPLKASGEPCDAANSCEHLLCLGSSSTGETWCSQTCADTSDCMPLLDAEPVWAACCTSSTQHGDVCAINASCP